MSGLPNQRSDIPLSALCAQCQLLFSRENDPLTSSKPPSTARVRYDTASESTQGDDCHVCTARRRMLPFALPVSESSEMSLTHEPGSVDVFNLYSHSYDVSNGTEHKTRVMEFFESHLDSKCPAIQLDPLAHTLGRSAISVNPNVAAESTQNEACFDLVRHWLHTCDNEHELCRRARVGTDFFQLPTRLIDVRNGLKLVETAVLRTGRQDVKYATLSHRWKEGPAARLLHSNLGSMKQAIDPRCLTQVFRDSIDAVRRLDIGFIWIDALCVLQDSAADWARESSRMGDVYRYACLNIGASIAAQTEETDTGWRVLDVKVELESTGGLYVRRNTAAFSMTHVKILRKDHAKRYFGFTRDVQTVGHQFGPLMQRGWVLQERLLSPRSVYYGQQLTWECPELLANEVFPEGSPSKKLINPWNLNSPLRFVSLAERRERDALQYGDGLRINDTYRTWLHLVEKYRHCQLTFHSDALPALSGLASQFQNKFKDDYLAGIWRRDLIRGLLWHRCIVHCRGRIMKYPLPKYRGMYPYSPSFAFSLTYTFLAPSWSWAATNLSINCPHITRIYRSKEEFFVATVHDAEVTYAGSDSNGTLSAGFMKISGYLCPNTSKRVQALENLNRKTLDYEFFEAYDYSFNENDIPSHENSYLFVLTYRTPTTPGQVSIRGLILQPTLKHPEEYRRVGSFYLNSGKQPEFAGLDMLNAPKQTITII
jgi:hypothetical protein